jgi:spore maturation protein CgeB
LKIIIPNFPERDNFAENVATTLSHMGHTPITPSAASVRSPRNSVEAVARELYRRVWPDRWTVQDRWLVATARASRADMLLCLTHAPSDEVLAEVRAAGVRHLAAWWGDTPANMKLMGLLSDFWDRIYLKDIDGVRKFQAVNLPATLLHEAMNPLWHKRNFTKVGDQVAIAGSYYNYRQFLVERLISREIPLALYGPRPPRWARQTVAAAHLGRFIVKEEKSHVFGGALACLNSTTLSEGNGLNCRAFEIAGACGLQLIEPRPIVEQCFEPSREVLLYRSVDEIIEHVSRARLDPQWAMAIREAGHRRAHADHTYAKRLERIIGDAS